MGQVNLVRIGQDYLNPGGSFTLTTGILADHPVVLTTSAAMVNGGIHSFVRAAALELRNGIRINVVSSGLVEDAVERYEAYLNRLASFERGFNQGVVEKTGESDILVQSVLEEQKEAELQTALNQAQAARETYSFSIRAATTPRRD